MLTKYISSFRKCSTKRRLETREDIEPASHTAGFKAPDTNLLGRKLKMRFLMEDIGKMRWFEGQIISYDPATSQYGAYFPSDNQTVMINPLSEGGDIKLLD